MKKCIVLVMCILTTLMLGCSPSEPTVKEIERGFREMVYEESNGVLRAGEVRVKKTGRGLYMIRFSCIGPTGSPLWFNGEARLDDEGAIHYYTD